MDPVPKPVFQQSSTMNDVARAFIEHPHEVFYVVDGDWKLEGVITMTDWLRALSNGATPQTPVFEIMVKRPVVITAQDHAPVAAGVLREYSLKSLPVVEQGDRSLVGCLRARRLIAHFFSRAATLELSLASTSDHPVN